MSKRKYAEAARLFPRVYVCALVSLINRYPMLSAIEGLEKMLDERAAEITYVAIESFLLINQAEMDDMYEPEDEEFSFLVTFVSNNLDYRYVDEAVKRYCKNLVLNGWQLRLLSKN